MLSPRLILFSIPSSLFLTWCSYIKYLSKLKPQCSRSVCWLGGGRWRRGWTLACVFISHTRAENKQPQKRTFFVHSGCLVLGSLTRFSAYSLFPSCASDAELYQTFEFKIQYSVCFTSLHDVCLYIRLRIRTLLSARAHVHMGPLLDCGSINARRGLWFPDQVSRSTGGTQAKFSLVWFADLTRLSGCVYFHHWCE